MQKDYLTLKNGQQFRVEVNWNSISDFLELQGLDDLAAIDNLSKLKVSDISGLIWACVREGERMDGNEFTQGIRDFGAKLTPANIGKFMELLKEQLDTGEKEEAPKKKAPILFGRKS